MISKRKEDRPMDIRERILAARMSLRIEKYEKYCKEIGIIDKSGYKSAKEISRGKEKIR